MNTTETHIKEIIDKLTQLNTSIEEKITKYKQYLKTQPEQRNDEEDQKTLESQQQDIATNDKILENLAFSIEHLR